MNNQISHQDFMTIIDQKRNYRELKQSIRMMKVKKIKKQILIKYKTILSYCLKYKNNTENINPEVSKTSNGKSIILSKCAVCDDKNQNLLKNKKQKDY